MPAAILATGTITHHLQAVPSREERVMTAVVNLNRVRKAKKRLEEQRRAAENRAAFGRSKAARRLAESEEERSRRTLDDKRLD